MIQFIIAFKNHLGQYEDTLIANSFDELNQLIEPFNNKTGVELRIKVEENLGVVSRHIQIFELER